MDAVELFQAFAVGAFIGISFCLILDMLERH